MTNPLEFLVHTPVGEALGWALFHSLWQGAAAALSLVAVLALTRSARVRYAAACAALTAALGAFALTFAWFLPAGGAGGTALSPPAAVSFPGLDGVAAAGGAAGAADALPWFVALWLAGFVLFQARGVRQWIAARRLRTRAVCAAPDAWRRRLDALSARMRVARAPELLESGAAEIPAVTGWLRPAILVPAGFLAAMPPEQVEAILLHELAHVLRRDYLASLLQTAAEGFLFHHPAVWWISSVIRREREHCCDDLAAAAAGGALAYASALAALERTRWGAEKREALVLAAGGRAVDRVRRLLFPSRPLSVRSAWAAAPLLIAIVAVLAGWQGAGAQQPAPAPKADPYTRWLTEDVAYIIEDREREAFLRLKSDEERKHFIEQFWQRRATPGTPVNEVREEHYRRHVSANERFGRPGIQAGWRTDRGRVWIVRGPPDEIEKHPSGRNGGPPSEQWLYYRIEGAATRVIFVFLDTARDGSYRLKEDPVKKR